MDNSAPDAIDWERSWQDWLRTSLAQEQNDEDEWDKLARRYDAVVSSTTYADEFIARMELNPDFTVLDRACGPGTLAIPLAKRVKSITALDQSGEMLQIIQEKMRASGITNITRIHRKWEEVAVGVDIERHDIVISSRYISAPNLKAELLKLNDAALRYVYLTATADNGECHGLRREICELIGKPYLPKCEYIYHYNMLYQLGIQAHVDFIYYTNHYRFQSVDAAFNMLNTGIQVETAEQKQKMIAYLERGLAEKGVFETDSLCRWALIWWPKAGASHDNHRFKGQRRHEE